MCQVFTTLLAPSCLPWPPEDLRRPEGLTQPFLGEGWLAQQWTYQRDSPLGPRAALAGMWPACFHTAKQKT